MLQLHKSVCTYAFFDMPQHLFFSSLAECVHHFGHFFELFEQLVDVCKGHAAALRNPGTPTSIEQIGLYKY